MLILLFHDAIIKILLGLCLLVIRMLNSLIIAIMVSLVCLYHILALPVDYYLILNLISSLVFFLILIILFLNHMLTLSRRFSFRLMDGGIKKVLVSHLGQLISFDIPLTLDVNICSLRAVHFLLLLFFYCTSYMVVFKLFGPVTFIWF